MSAPRVAILGSASGSQRLRPADHARRFPAPVLGGGRGDHPPGTRGQPPAVRVARLLCAHGRDRAVARRCPSWWRARRPAGRSSKRCSWISATACATGWPPRCRWTRCMCRAMARRRRPATRTATARCWRCCGRSSGRPCRSSCRTTCTATFRNGWWQACDALVVYRTNPHVDARERAAESADLLREMLSGTRTAKAFIRLPLTPPSVTLLTAEGPYADLMRFGQEFVGVARRTCR